MPAGTSAVHWMAFQFTSALASNTRDSNTPGVVAGNSRIQSTKMMPPNGLKSLAATGRIGPGTTTVCVATSTPSM